MKRFQGISLLQCLALTGAFLASLSCGSKKKTDDPATTTTASLTTSYKNNCVTSGCHGSDGAATPTGARSGHGVLKATSLKEADFLSIVRNGQPANTIMIPYPKSVMSDAD